MTRKTPTDKQIDYALYLQTICTNKKQNMHHTREELGGKRRRYVTAYIENMMRTIPKVTASPKQVEWALDLIRFLERNRNSMHETDRERFEAISKSELQEMSTYDVGAYIDRLLAIKNGVHNIKGEYSKFYKRRA